jgi:hypothetical protein
VTAKGIGVPGDFQSRGETVIARIMLALLLLGIKADVTD